MTESWASEEAFRQAQSRIDGIVAEAEQRYERARAAREDLEHRTVSAESTRGEVRVTVAANGTLRDLELGERADRWSRSELSTEILACVRRAYAKLPELAEEVYAERFGAHDAAAEHAVSLLREAFGGQEDAR
ncbi:YbaB/EbfC family nucleoid-associated protein [Sciscionella marina]|uniref:YbaB/EbfC family nucleoid-associated protein n=1 Tax=Sciscionella marina TaxID=508770 RepID=UPI00036B7D21|nr:YbaB/EbfC family nucleoid-associated protein [Sciscionella marina]